MKVLNIWIVSVMGFLIFSSSASAAEGKYMKQLGFGAGVISPVPMPSSVYALSVALEGTYRLKYVGLSILATANSSTSIGGTYWFGSGYGTQQTLLEPRVYLGFLHIGYALGLSLSEGTSQIQTLLSHGPMAGFEIPLGRFSVGADARYFFDGSTVSSVPLSMLAMFRFKF